MDIDYGLMLRNKYPAINAVASIERHNTSQYYMIKFYNTVYIPSVLPYEEKQEYIDSPRSAKHKISIINSDNVSKKRRNTIKYPSDSSTHIDGIYFFIRGDNLHYGIHSSNDGIVYDYTLGWYDERKIPTLDLKEIVDEIFRLTHFPIQPNLMNEIRMVHQIRTNVKNNMSNVHDELLVLPPFGKFPGGSVYNDAKNNFYELCKLLNVIE